MLNTVPSSSSSSSSAAAASATAASASALFPIEEEALPEKKVRKEEKTISFEHGSGQRLVLPNSTPQNIYTYFDIGTTLEFSAQRPETKRCASLCFCFFFKRCWIRGWGLKRRAFRELRRKRGGNGRGMGGELGRRRDEEEVCEAESSSSPSIAMEGVLLQSSANP